jgi:hypothetical protein
MLDADIPQEAYNFIFDVFAEETFLHLGIADSSTDSEILKELEELFGVRDVPADLSRDSLLKLLWRESVVVRDMDLILGESRDQESRRYVARFGWDTRCGASGNCPIVVFGRDYDGRWKVFEESGGVDAFLFPGGSDIQLFISWADGAGRHGLGKLIVGEGYVENRGSVDMLDEQSWLYSEE